MKQKNSEVFYGFFAQRRNHPTYVEQSVVTYGHVARHHLRQTLDPGLDCIELMWQKNQLSRNRIYGVCIEKNPVYEYDAQI